MFTRKLIVAVCVVALAQAAFAQGAKPAAPVAASAPAVKAQPILEAIPAGTMGYVVVPSIKGTFGDVTKFLEDIGVSELLQAFMPGDLLDMVKTQAKLGDGFNAEGGFAVVMLDPAPFGIDFVKMIDDHSDAKKDVPVVLFVPGNSVKDVFGAYEITTEGAYSKVELRMGTMYATQLGGYIVLSPMAKALETVTKAEKRAATELTNNRNEALLKSDLALNVNMKIAGPVYLAFVEKMMEMTKGQAGMNVFPTKLLNSVMPFYRQMFQQLDSLAITLSFGRSGGLVFEEFVTALPDSTMGKALAAYKPTGEPLMDRLPNLPYVFAMGSQMCGKDASVFQADMIDTLVKGLEISEASRAKIKKLTATSEDQVTSYQLVIGGAPEGAGVAAAAVVINCKDSEVVKPLIADSADVTLTVIKELIGKDKDSKDLDVSVAYKKDADKVGDLSVDTLTIDSNVLNAMEADDKANMKAILGQDKLVFFVASPDKTTVVVTFGGDKAFLAEALKAAKGGGTIGKDPQTVEALKALPKNPNSVVLFNFGNLWQVVTKGAKALGKGDDIPPLNIEGKTPIVVGSAISGNTVQVTFYVPSSLVKEIVDNVKMFMGMGGPRHAGGAGAAPGKSPAGGKDF